MAPHAHSLIFLFQFVLLVQQLELNGFFEGTTNQPGQKIYRRREHSYACVGQAGSQHNPSVGAGPPSRWHFLNMGMCFECKKQNMEVWISPFFLFGTCGPRYLLFSNTNIEGHAYLEYSSCGDPMYHCML